MKKSLKILEKIPYLLERLSSKPEIGGAQLTNAGIQYILFEKGKPKTLFFRFPPGVMSDGRIQNRDQFIAVLRKLHEAIEPEKESKNLQIVVTLPSELVYSQSFSVPNIGQEELKESADLNLKMVSPMPSEKTYSGWQVIKKNPTQYELFGAFVDRAVVDEFREAFLKASFHVVVFEFPGLALAHLVQKTLTPSKESTLLIYVSSDGLDLSILRNNRLSFNYFRSWKSIQGEDSQISREVFNRVVVSEIQKVLNFSSSKFKESFEKALIVAPGFEGEIRELILQNFPFSSMPISVSSEKLTPAWYVVWGAALRGELSPTGDNRINLNSETSAEIFFQEHLLSFVHLWRNVLILVFAFFIVVFGISAYFLNNYEEDLQTRILASKSEVDTQELSLLYDRATEFNALVSGLTSEFSTSVNLSRFFDRFFALADAGGVIIKNIELTSGGSSARIIAEAPNNSAALTFKNTLTKEDGFGSVELPLFGISDTGQNTVQFSMTFVLDQEFFSDVTTPTSS